MNVEEIVTNIVLSVLEISESEFSPEKSLVDDLGAASIHLGEIISEVENEFDLRIDNRELAEMRTTMDIVSYVNSNIDGA